MRKILIVEDDTALKELYTNAFNQSGYEVTSIGNPDTTKEVMVDQKFDVILLDLLFPQSDGTHAIDYARAADSKNIDTPVIILTNVDDKEKIKEVLKKGATKCLFKFEHTPKTLIGEVEDTLSGKEKR
jgi:DNA-binding response OmpR family regulator